MIYVIMLYSFIHSFMDDNNDGNEVCTYVCIVCSVHVYDIDSMFLIKIKIIIFLQYVFGVCVCVFWRCEIHFELI